MTYSTGHSFLLEPGIKIRVLFEQRFKSGPVPETGYQVLLLILERNMAVEAHLLGTIKDKVCLELGVGPGPGMHAF